jgi:hypothetical protein
MRFRDGKLVHNLSLLDTFDAVEQVLGQRIAIGNGAKNSAESDLVAL